MNNTSNTTNFIFKSKSIHHDKYVYDLVNYINAKTKIKIICPIHGIFEQTPNGHLSGKGCGKCVGKNKTNEDFIDIAMNIHRNKYEYSLVEYKNAYSKVSIMCKKHGIFEQLPNNHLSGQGCPICSESKGEKEIREFLNKNEIFFISEKTFINCKNKRKLPFDFYIPEYNMCIEYQGKQHYEPIKYFGGENYLKEIKLRDKIKREYCLDNNIKLLIIRYDDDIKIMLDKKFTINYV